MRARLSGLLVVAIVATSQAHAMPLPFAEQLRPVTRAVGKSTLVASVKMKVALDHAQAKLGVAHPKLAAAFGSSRRMLKPFSPLRIAGFAAARVKRNPMLVPAYLSVSLPIDAARMYALAMLPPAIGGSIYLAGSVVQTVTALLTAEHVTAALRGEHPTLRGTVHGINVDYAAYNVRQDEKIARAARALGVE